MSGSKSLFYILLASFLLVVTAGSAFTGFQGWIVAQSASSQNVNQPIFVSSGLRITSSVPLTPELTSLPLNPIVKKTTVQPTLQLNSDIEHSQFTATASKPDQGAVNLSRPAQIPNLGSLDYSPAQPQTEPSKYSSDKFSEPSIVLYEDEVAVEFPKAIADLKTIKKSLARLILSPEPFNEQLVSNESLSFNKLPYFYKQVLNQKGEAIRYPAKALAYIDHLIQTDALQQIEDADGHFTVVHIPLTQPNYPKPVERYKAWVDDYAKEFAVSPSLVFAIMETESGFRPQAVSTSKAMGLMQLKASAAGRDVFEQVDKRLGQPNQAQLFDEKENIRMGTAYLGLLNHDYLTKVRNPKSKELLAISSYNGGLSTVLKLFGNSNEKALEQINRLHPRQVYRKLRFEHQSKETRDYLDKVLRAKSRYQELLET